MMAMSSLTSKARGRPPLPAVTGATMIEGTDVDLTALRTGALRRLRRNWQKLLDHKHKMMAKHDQGTIYYNRAVREAGELVEYIEQVDAELARRQSIIDGD